ncbi:transcription factor zms1 [Fusarium longipes]|uniref:Transcription factor zms1 n=1 Tax=Fusarium longipes TaxID=694270 RepID=A0A395S7X7_9HYPO|nr:transcription factor zms1 [Fusarium longipes]
MTQQGVTSFQSPGLSSPESAKEDAEVLDHARALGDTTGQTSIVMENNAVDNSGDVGWITHEHQPITMAPTGDLMDATSLPESMFQINDLGDFAVERTTAEPTMGAPNINWLSDNQYLSMWESQLPAVPSGLGHMAYTFSSGLVRPNVASPWISTNYNDVGVTEVERSAPNLGYTSNPVATISPQHSRADSNRGSSTSRSNDGALYVDGTMARAPFRGQLLGRHMNQNSTSSAAGVESDNEAPDSLEASGQTGYSHYVSHGLYSKLVSAAREHAGLQVTESTTSLIPPIGSSQSRAPLDLTTLQAAILSMIDRLHSGQKIATERALGQRFILVEQCRRMNLLSRTPPKIDNGIIPGNTLIVAEWLQAQSELRTGLMLWVLDSIIAYEFDCPHLLQLHEVKTTLPCQEEMWDEPTLEQIQGNSYHQATVFEALHLLYMEKRQPSNLTEFGNIAMIYAVCQRTKEAAYQYETALSRWTPVAHVEPCSQSSTVVEAWPPSLGIIARWRNSACDCLDILHWKANGKAANAGGSEHPTILLLHLSRLYLLAPHKHLQKVATYTWLSGANDEIYDTTGHSEACTHLRRWANVDQYKARLSIIHAGALMWHVRRYSSDGFIEPHAIHLATLLLWAYSIFTARSMSPELPQNTGVSTPRHELESYVPKGSINPRATPNRDHEDDEEEPEPAFIHLDRPCDDEMVQTYIRLGHKMQGYMQRVGDICSSDAPPKILKEGIRLLSHRRAKEKAWGIENSFVKSLTSLLDATIELQSERTAASGLP